MPTPPLLEDELGDVLDKALRNAGLTEEMLAEATGIDVGRIKDAEDYRYDFSCGELQRLAAALGLNEVGVCALGEGKYPLPRLPALPFALYTIELPYGIGHVNAFAVTHPGTGAVLLIDSGNCPEGLAARWPSGVPTPAAVFLTHWDRDHAGGLAAVLGREPLPTLYAPAAPRAVPAAIVPVDRESSVIADFSVQAFRTPGHTAEHNAYLVTVAGNPDRGVLFSGDLVFAGSLGGAFFCCRTLLREARRLIAELPGGTVIAPGHGPLTTVENERRFNPFLG
jgi:hydroxyacylglutathione hydrolase